VTTYSAEQIQANRKKFIASLRRSKRQCRGTLFSDKKACAIGVAMRALFGVRNEGQLYAKIEADNAYDPYALVAEALGIPGETDYYTPGAPLSVRHIYRWNDGEDMTFPQIAGKLAEVWSL